MGGVERLSDMLSSQSASTSEAVRAEAAGVVAQILSPCLEQYTPVAGFLENMDDLVRALTSECGACLSRRRRRFTYMYMYMYARQ